MDKSKEELRRLYPGLTDEELEIAAENIDRYLLAAWDIWQEKKAREVGAGASDGALNNLRETAAMPDATLFHTGERVLISGKYCYARHSDRIRCKYSHDHKEIVLMKGETFPPMICQHSAVWEKASTH